MSDQKPEIQKKDNASYVLLFLLGLLLASGVYIFFHQPITAVQNNYQYSNGETIFNVTKVSDTDTYITLYIGKEQTPYAIDMRNDPLSLENITVDGMINTRIYGDKQIYVTVNPNANLSAKTTIAALEIDKIIDNPKLYNITVSSAMTLPNTYGYPVKTCNDGSDNTTIIWLTLGSETTVYTDNYCIIVVGTSEDGIIRAADRLVYQLLGIMR